VSVRFIMRKKRLGYRESSISIGIYKREPALRPGSLTATTLSRITRADDNWSSPGERARAGVAQIVKQLIRRLVDALIVAHRCHARHGD